MVINAVTKCVGEGARPVVKALIDSAYESEENKWKNGVYVTTQHVKRRLPNYNHIESCLNVIGKNMFYIS